MQRFYPAIISSLIIILIFSSFDASSQQEFFLDSNTNKATDQIREAIAQNDYHKVLLFCEEARDRGIKVRNMQFFEEIAQQKLSENKQVFDAEKTRKRIMQATPTPVPKSTPLPEVFKKVEQNTEVSQPEPSSAVNEVQQTQSTPTETNEPVASAPKGQSSEIVSQIKGLDQKYKIAIASVLGLVLLTGIFFLFKGRKKDDDEVEQTAVMKMDTALTTSSQTESTLPVFNTVQDTEGQDNLPMFETNEENDGKTMPISQEILSEEKTILMPTEDDEFDEEQMAESLQEPSSYFTPEEKEDEENASFSSIPAEHEEIDDDAIILDEEETVHDEMPDSLKFEDEKEEDERLVIHSGESESSEEDDESVDISFDAMDAQTGDTPYKNTPTEKMMPDSGISLHDEKTIIEFASDDKNVEDENLTLAEKQDSGIVSIDISTELSGEQSGGADPDETIADFQARSMGDEVEEANESNAATGEQTVFNPSAKKDAAFQAEFDKGLKAFEHGNWKDAVHYFNIAVALDSENQEVKDKLRIAREKQKVS